MDAYKVMPEPTPPPAVIHLILTEDEYNVLKEGAYQVHWGILHGKKSGQSSVAEVPLKGDESMDDIAKRLYSNLPTVDMMRTE